MDARADVFVSYAHLDEAYWPDLEVQLKILKRKGYLDWWIDKKLIPGDEWEPKILDALRNADLILLVVSPYFLASDFGWEVELAEAIQRHDEGKARVVPIFLQVCDASQTPIDQLQGVPNRDKPVLKWGNRQEAWTVVAQGIQAAVQEWRSQ
ncbi:MAG: toll/interleukin-1 receptor domain-containing protein [Planctomycetota bacterium]|nr:toll/interleukin-1 receptor domain-containing protein [Planctomycetota bacterium]